MGSRQGAGFRFFPAVVLGWLAMAAAAHADVAPRAGQAAPSAAAKPAAAPASKRFLADPRLEFTPDGETAYLIGSIPEDYYLRFAAPIRAHKKLRRIVLSSGGGSVIAGYQMANLVRASGLTTYVDQVCESSCTIVFAAGKERVLAAGGELGFHQSFSVDDAGKIVGAARYQSAGLAAVRLSSAKNTFIFENDGDGPIIKALRRIGVRDDFIRKVLETPPTELWSPTPEELTASGLVTRAAATAEVPPPKGAFVTPAAIEARLRTNVLWNALSAAQPEGFAKDAAHIARAVNSGLPFKDAEGESRAPQIRALVPRIPLAADPVAERFLAFFAADAAEQRTLDYAACAPRSDIMTLLPPEESASVAQARANEDALYAELVASQDTAPRIAPEEARRIIAKEAKRLNATGFLTGPGARDEVSKCRLGVQLFEAIAQLEPKRRLPVFRASLSAERAAE